MSALLGLEMGSIQRCLAPGGSRRHSHATTRPAPAVMCDRSVSSEASTQHHGLIPMSWQCCLLCQTRQELERQPCMPSVVHVHSPSCCTDPGGSDQARSTCRIAEMQFISHLLGMAQVSSCAVETMAPQNYIWAEGCHWSRGSLQPHSPMKAVCSALTRSRWRTCGAHPEQQSRDRSSPGTCRYAEHQRLVHS